MFSRFVIYFDEIVRAGSIRRAAERLHISPSAIDRHVLLMEERLGLALFERLPQGLRLTAAGEVLVTYIRRWRRELTHAHAQIDDLRGLRRGEVTIAIAEGVIDFISRALVPFRQEYPGIDQNFLVAGAQAVGQYVLEGRAEIGLSFNPPTGHGLRLERTLVYQLGAVVTPRHPLAGLAEVRFSECIDHALLLPDESLSYRMIIDTMWARCAGGRTRGSVNANSIGLIKALICQDAGVGFLTMIDVAAEVDAGDMVFVPLAESDVPLSVLSLVTASGRTLPMPASLLLQHIIKAMGETGVSGIA